MKTNDLFQRFTEWERKNPEVYRLFKKFTFEAIGKGKKHYSPWVIVNLIRWETEVRTTGDDFKISNDFIALYSRKFMSEFPEHRGFFRTKEMKRSNGERGSQSELF